MIVEIDDGKNAIDKSPWLDKVSMDVGIAIHEICNNPDKIGFFDKQ